MQKELSQLVELQKLDSQLLQLESLRGDLPRQVERLKQELDETRQSHEEKVQKLKAYQREKGIVEMEIKALEGKQKKYQTQLYEVKTNREYDAVTHEIESVKSETEKKESRLLELMDLETETAESIKTTSEHIETLTDLFDRRKTELEQTLAKTEKDEAALQHERNKIVRMMKPRILATYDRIRKAKNGFAVAPVIRNACGGCYKTLPPQRILEIRQMDRMYLCEVCGRILVWDARKSEVAG
ncbi:MAG: C4-type zinc ribbon domain-containing protein [bacterium]